MSKAYRVAKANAPDFDPDAPVTRLTHPQLFCVAQDCPLRWSVSIHRACSYHAWEDTREWPRITSQLQAHGPWKLRSTTADTPTVRDMKTRLKGHIGNIA